MKQVGPVSATVGVIALQVGVCRLAGGKAPGVTVVQFVTFAPSGVIVFMFVLFAPWAGPWHKAMWLTCGRPR